MMMEAARLIQTLGQKPRRTIRIALWDAEEEGLLGSLAYVKQHFGTFEDPKPEYSKLVAYFNIDSGTGRVRGASVFGPPEAAAVVRAALAPFEDLGVAGAVPPPAAPWAAPTAPPSATRPGRHRPATGPHRVSEPHLAHQPRYLRAHRPGGRPAGRYGDCGRGLARGHSRPDVAALHQGADAAPGGSALKTAPKRFAPELPGIPWHGGVLR